LRLVLLQCRRHCPVQFGLVWRQVLGWRLCGRWLFRRRRIFGRRRLIGRRWCFGELVMTISNQDHERITRAIRLAEQNTSGEIVCVLARISSNATVFPLFVSAIAALVTPWLLVAFTAMPVLRILFVQVILFGVL